MNKKITMSELVDILAQKHNCPKRIAENFVKELLTLMTDTISSGETLRINGLGVFKPTWVEERASVNVQTGEPTVIPGHYKLTFTPVKAVREAINEPFACFCVEELPDDAPIVADAPLVDEMGDDSADEEVEVPAAEDKNIEQPSVSETATPVPSEQEVPAEQPHFIEKEEEVTSVEIDEKANEIVEEPAADPVVADEEPAPVIAEDTTTPVVDETSTPIVDATNNNSKAYVKGIWQGVLATVVVFVVAIALLLLCFPAYRTTLSQLPEYAGSLFAHNEPTALSCDTIEVAPVDTAVVDSIVSDTLSLVVAEPEVLPVVVDTIRRGVFLTNMSYKHYGHKAFWVYIYEENSHIISNPDNVPVGTVITIPPLEKYGVDANDTTDINVALEKARLIKQAMKR